MTSSIISTDDAKCRDCYRCVRVCPIKAIRIQDGQARVDSERCILCGTCVRECPQKAKHVRDDLDILKKLLKKSKSPSDGDKKPLMIASLAPSFPAAFSEYGGGFLQAALKKLGFDLVTETAVGAEMVAKVTADLIKDKKNIWITSACPVVVNLIEKYHSNACKNITPILSPMLAHAAYLKSKYGKNSGIVFIGPCAAKKYEAENDKQHLIDAVLTFEELQEVLDSSHISISQLEPIPFDDVRPNNAQLFPIDGGLAETAAISSGLLAQDFAAISGSEHIFEMVEHISEDSPIRLFEALFCPGGCINGPCIGKNQNIFSKKNKILQYHKRKSFESEVSFDVESTSNIDLAKQIEPIIMPHKDYSEEQIRAVLMETGKNTPEDELNCGACGYPSCRDNALAVLSGMAENSMCLPWMRRLAERKANQIIDKSPNGIVVVDSNFNIVSLNPAFANMFSCSESIIGKPISMLMDPADFETVAADLTPMISNKTINLDQYALIASVDIYKLQDENMIIGLFSNITKTKSDEDKIARIRSETIDNAQRVIEQQMRMAQEIAGILGETTSETRVLLRKLTDIAREAENPQER